MNWVRITRCIIICLILSTQASAIQVQTFEPNFDQNGGIAVQNTSTIPQWDYRPSLILNWVRNPIEFGIVTTDSRTDTIVGWFLTANILFAAGIRDDLTVGLDLPFNFGSEIEPVGTITQEDQLNIGELSLYAKYRMRERKEGDRKFILNLAVVPFFTLPTGADENFFGHKNVTGGFKFAGDWKLAERHQLAANLGTRIAKSETVLNLTVGSEFLWGMGYRYLLSSNHDINLNVELYGSTTYSKFFTQEISSPIELLIGVNKPWMDKRIVTTAGIGRGGNNGYGSPDFRFFVGATYVGTKKHLSKEELEERKKDTDGDHVKDRMDQCVDAAEDMDQFEDGDGCPDPDNDRDGIEDANDKCPNEAEVINGVDDGDGCMDQGDTKVTIQDQKIVILEKIYFESNKGAILDKSIVLLDQVASVLKANLQVTKVRIEGHTDNRGPAQYNKLLSQQRADNIRKYLIQTGIEEGRLEAVGFGDTQPVESNDTPKGREANRRVDFVIVESK